MTRLLGWLLLAAPAYAQTLDKVLADIAAVRKFQDVAISPDGNRVAWVEDLRGSSAIYVMDWRSPGAAPRRIGAGDGKMPCNEHSLAWAPDSRRIAFLSDCGKKNQLELWIAPATGGAARKLTNLTGYLAKPRWSPDGTRVAFLFAENAPAGGGPLEAVPAVTGVIEEQIYNQRLAIVEVAGGRVRQISPPNLHVYEYDWSPDGRSFAAVAAPGPGDNNWWLAQLYALTIDTGETRSIYRPSLEIAVPRWSPDGAHVAFIQGLMSDEGFNGGDICVVAAAGGAARNLTADRKASPNWVSWLSPGKLLFTEHLEGGSAISTLDVATGQAHTLWKGDEDVHADGHRANFSLARDGETSAVVRHSWQHPPELWAGTVGKWRQVTQWNQGRRAGWGEARSVHWSSDGLQIQGWLLYPRDYSPSGRYPMIVSVHGGPANIRKPAWPNFNFDLSALASQGYFVFFPNPRGSYGQGAAFTAANVKDFGGGDLRDILAGVDQVVRTVPVDERRIGISGWSYGGYMTMWTVTQTNRFRAAVAGAGIANWQSYYGQNSIDQWMLPYFGATVYDDPAVYAKSSPIQFIRNVKTPTLVVVGERDGECPPPQSYEFWHALKTLGIPTSLVIYAGEGHMFRQPDHQRDVIRRTVEWFDRYLR